jgi:hypothetical protein
MKIVNSDKPFDAYVKFCSNRGIAIDQTSEQFEERIMIRWQKIQEESRKNVRVCCFSENNDSILMWSHYADEHRGICVEYDFLDADNIRYLIQPILYSDERLAIDTMEGLTVLSQVMAAVYKATVWSYESEWRITAIPKEDGKVPESIFVPRPKAIYLGPRFSENNPAYIAKFHAIVESLDIPVHNMILHPTQYKLIKK